MLFLKVRFIFKGKRVKLKPRVSLCRTGVDMPKPISSKTISMAQENILVADDEQGIRKLFAKLFRDSDYKLFFACNGEEAVALAEKHPIDVAILDLGMPKMDGIAALKRIKEIDETIEILVITGNTELEVMKQVLFDYGAFDYLIKPFDIVELKLTVQRALHNKAAVFKKTSVERELKNRILELEQNHKEKTFRLRESQIKYKNIVNNSTDTIVIIQNTLVKFVNRRALDLTGFSRDEMLNVPFTDLLHPEDRAEALQRHEQRIASDHSAPPNKIRVRKKDGTFFWVENHTVTTTWQDSPAILNFIRDISQQKRMEEVMIRSEKMASLGQLSAGLAHELRNPLAVISSCAQFCLENMTLERLVAENFQVIYRNSQRASTLISELLEFARPDRLKWTSVNLNRLFERMLHMAKLEVDPSHVTFVKRFEKELPEILGDEEKLGQVCINLIQNAIQAISRNGTITLETRVDPTTTQAAEISIADNGSGIPREHRKRIFDPFFTTKDGGTGLGLSICHAIVEQHHGNISVECGEGGGTRIAVNLPVKQEAAAGDSHEH